MTIQALVIGIGSGNPDHLTREAVAAHAGHGGNGRLAFLLVDEDRVDEVLRGEGDLAGQGAQASAAAEATGAVRHGQQASAGREGRMGGREPRRCPFSGPCKPATNFYGADA